MAKGGFNPQEIEEFSIQITELLKLRVIRYSNSRHKSTTYMVRNHAKVKRGKVRMVINYKCLNDNKYENQYKILDKVHLINCIQYVNIFGMFDYRLGFWQIKMDDDSILWAVFNCLEGHFKWIVISFGLKVPFLSFYVRLF